MQDFNTSYITNLLTLFTDGLIIYFGRNGIDLKRNARFQYIIYHQLINTIYRWTDYIFWKEWNRFEEECKISIHHMSPTY
jgi:hypothetical protein